MSPEQDNVARLYTHQREAYARFAPQSFGWVYIERPSLDKHLAGLLSPVAKVIDAGCGVGRTVKYLVEAGVALPNILAIDVNPDMVKVTRKTVPQVKIIQADIEYLPVSNDSQDIVLCTHVLHYFDNDKYLSTMRTFRRILKPGGVLFTIITHPIRTSKSDLSQYFKRRWIIDQTPWGTASPLFFRPTSDLVNLALEAGLTLESLDELEVHPDGKDNNPIEYQKYAVCPPRLALKLKK